MERLTETAKLFRDSKANRFNRSKSNLDKLNWLWVIVVVIIGVKLLLGI